MHSNPDKSGHDYAADYSFRYSQSFKRKTPRSLNQLIIIFFLCVLCALCGLKPTFYEFTMVNISSNFQMIAEHKIQKRKSQSYAQKTFIHTDPSAAHGRFSLYYFFDTASTFGHNSWDRMRGLPGFHLIRKRVSNQR